MFPCSLWVWWRKAACWRVCGPLNVLRLLKLSRFYVVYFTIFTMCGFWEKICTCTTCLELLHSGKVHIKYHFRSVWDLCVFSRVLVKATGCRVGVSCFSSHRCISSSRCWKIVLYSSWIANLFSLSCAGEWSLASLASVYSWFERTGLTRTTKHKTSGLLYYLKPFSLWKKTRHISYISVFSVDKLFGRGFWDVKIREGSWEAKWCYTNVQQA